MKFCTMIAYVEDILFLDKRPKPGIDIMLTGCLHLGHDKEIVKMNLEQASQRGQRASEKERNARNIKSRSVHWLKKLHKKKLRLNQPGGQVSDILFENELPTHADASSQTDEFEYLFSTAAKERPFDEFNIRNNNKKVNFYTGLP